MPLALVMVWDSPGGCHDDHAGEGTLLLSGGRTRNWIYLCPVEAYAVYEVLRWLYLNYVLTKKKNVSGLSAVKEAAWEMSLLSLPHKGDMKMKKLMFLTGAVVLRWQAKQHYVYYDGYRCVPVCSSLSPFRIAGVRMVSLGKDISTDC